MASEATMTSVGSSTKTVDQSSSYYSISGLIRNKNKKDLNQTLYLRDYKTPNQVCIFCSRTFKDVVELDIHILTHNHIKSESKRVASTQSSSTKKSETLQKKPINIWLKCRQCTTVLEDNMDNGSNHKCFIRAYERWMVHYEKLCCTGVALYCIFCKCQSFSSRSELICHLICYHSDNYKSYQCSICQCEFQNTNPLLKEWHMLNEHLGSMELAFLKSRNIINGKRFQADEFHPFFCNFIEDNKSSKICGIISSDIASFTLHILTCHCPTEKSRVESLVNYNLSKLKRKDMEHSEPTHTTYTEEDKEVTKDQECQMCRIQIHDKKEYETHIDMIHGISFIRTLDYHIRRGYFQNVIDSRNVCMLCLRVFQDVFSKQIHMYIFHCSLNWKRCGLCNTFVIDTATNENNENYDSSNLLYKHLLIHETNHLKKLQSSSLNTENEKEILPKIITNETHINLFEMNLTLVEPPLLFKDEYIPIKTTEKKLLIKKQKKSYFSKEVRKNFLDLRKKNLDIQKELELYD